MSRPSWLWFILCKTVFSLSLIISAQVKHTQHNATSIFLWEKCPRKLLFQCVCISCLSLKELAENTNPHTFFCVIVQEAQTRQWWIISFHNSLLKTVDEEFASFFCQVCQHWHVVFLSLSNEAKNSEESELELDLHPHCQLHRGKVYQWLWSQSEETTSSNYERMDSLCLLVKGEIKLLTGCKDRTCSSQLSWCYLSSPEMDRVVRLN